MVPTELTAPDGTLERPLSAATLLKAALLDEDSRTKAEEEEVLEAESPTWVAAVGAAAKKPGSVERWVAWHGRGRVIIIISLMIGSCVFEARPRPTGGESEEW